MNAAKTKKQLSPQQRKELLGAVKARFSEKQKPP
jgi:hypothetical protein